MRVITPRDVIPGTRRQGLRLPARATPASLGVPPRAARNRSAQRACRTYQGADPQRVARRVPAQVAIRGRLPPQALEQGIVRTHVMLSPTPAVAKARPQDAT